jgi:hypothetical protein
MDFNSAYNTRRQIEDRGVRTQEDLADQAFDQLADAKKTFREACENCEYRRTDACPKKADMENIFWVFVENADARRRFRSRVQKKDVQHGLMAMPCAKLLAKARVRMADWDD